MKVALVHDYLNEFGGAERVLLALSEIWPDAPIYTAFYRKGSSAYKRFKDKKIVASWAQNVPFFASFLHSPLRFLAPLIWGSFGRQLVEFDVVITSASWFVTKGVIGSVPKHNKYKGRTLKPIEVCYCHTPPRYLYGYATAKKYGNPLISAYALLVNHFMRVYDYEAAQRVDYFIANSKEVQARIKKFYRRDSVVIYPPVDVERLSALGVGHSKGESPKAKGDYFLVVSRLAGAKNVDVAVEVCTNLKLDLKVIGSGHDRGRLEKMAGETVEFLGDVDDDELVRQYQNCRAVIFPASQEDFGIVPVEAMAAGKPVIALNEGGVKETVIGGKTGLLVDQLSVESFEGAIKRFMEMEEKGQWDSKFIQNHAQKFSKERFKAEILKFINNKVK